MDFAQAVTHAAHVAATKHGDDIDKAVDYAERKIRRLPEFAEWVNSLVRIAIRQRVQDARHTINGQIRKDLGHYGGPAKVVAGSSESVQRVARSVYTYMIGGTMLGLCTREKLCQIEQNEQAIADGHLANVRLVSKLKELVPEGKTVQESVSRRRLEAIFRECDLNTQKEAA